jgi:hypothetical protein
MPPTSRTRFAVTDLASDEAVSASVAGVALMIYHAASAVSEA